MKAKITTIVICTFLISVSGIATGLEISKDINEPKANSNILSDYPEIESLSYGRKMVKIIEQIDEETIEEYTENLTAIGPRVTGTQGCEQAAQYLYNELEEMGLEVRYQDWTVGALNSKNVEATLNGTDSSSNSIYVICAHYDSPPECPSADDNGAGTVSVLAAAKVLSQYTFKHTIRFVLFSGEEQGLLGSYEYAKEAKKHKDKLAATLDIDMTGYASNEKSGSAVQVYENRKSNWITKKTIEISEQYKEFIDLEVVTIRTNAAVSDNYCFWQFGYDSIFYYESETNPDFHTPGDNIENMNISYATKVAKLTMATIADFASMTFTIEGVTLYVSGSDPGNYSSIQDAIDDAENSDTVYVFSGTYDEHILIDEPINLIGETNTIITGAGQENVIELTGSWIYLTGFTIQNSGIEWLSAGIDVSSNHNIIYGNTISYNKGYGIGIYGKSYNTISNNMVTNNKDGIISWYSSKYNNIIENTIKDNEVCGVALSAESFYNEINKNTIENNKFGVYFQAGCSEKVYNPCYNKITKNEITKNEHGIYLNIVSKKNTFYNNNITYNKEGIFLGELCNKNIIKKNNFIGNDVHASFNSCKNLWFRNYWDNRTIKLGPKIIRGHLSLIPSIPSFSWFALDLFPARQPYEIG